MKWHIVISQTTYPAKHIYNRSFTIQKIYLYIQKNPALNKTEEKKKLFESYLWLWLLDRSLTTPFSGTGAVWLGNKGEGTGDEYLLEPESALASSSSSRAGCVVDCCCCCWCTVGTFEPPVLRFRLLPPPLLSPWFVLSLVLWLRLPFKAFRFIPA